MTNDERFEITGIDALSRDMFDAFERAAVAEKPKGGRGRLRRSPDPSQTMATASFRQFPPA